MPTALDDDRLERLIADAARQSQRRRDVRAAAREGRGSGFDGFVAADPRQLHDELARRRGASSSFLELGSGQGLVTIIADLLGYDACGIESRAELVDDAEDLAARHGAAPRFVVGSFLPRGEELGTLLDADFHVTDDQAASAWDEVRLRDFDLVYAFPWPGEEELFAALLQRHGRKGQCLLTWQSAEGFTELFV